MSIEAVDFAGWHIAVLIPARDEEELLPACIHSIDRACALLPSSVTSDIVVVSDGSTDRTFEWAIEKMRSHGVVLKTNVGCVGTARALAAKAALQRFTGDVAQCWLANTDADCCVPETWLLDHLRVAHKGWMAVAGIIDVTDFSEHLDHVERRFRDTYLVNEDGTHPHVHGANLGVRADAYLLAGGWAAMQTAEDHSLWSRLRSSGLPCLSDSRVQVTTSGRRVGRAPDGFARALGCHNEGAAS